MKIVLAIIVAIVFSGRASAQYEPLKFAICKKVTVDQARLKCFDEINDPPPAPENAVTTVEQWTFKEDKSPVDKAPQITAFLSGDPDNALLAFRCLERKTEVIFTPGKFFFVSNAASVLMRVNDLPLVTASWTASSNNRAIFAPNAVGFIRTIPDNAKIFLRATTGFEGRQADGTFNVGNISEVRDRVATACKWQTATPKAASRKANSPIALTPELMRWSAQC